jgi:hypothetical protein
MQRYEENTHQQVLELIESLSDGTTSDAASSVCNWLRHLSLTDLLHTDPQGLFYCPEQVCPPIQHYYLVLTWLKLELAFPVAL